MANRSSVAVADNETMALGLALTVSVPVPDVTVTGNVSGLAVVVVVGSVLEPQAASTVTAHMAATSAPARLLVWRNDISCSVSSRSIVDRSRSPGSRIMTPLAFPGPPGPVACRGSLPGHSGGTAPDFHRPSRALRTAHRTPGPRRAPGYATARTPAEWSQ